MDHERYMMAALELAREAADAGEVPVGCVIVGSDGEIIGRGRNRREAEKTVLAHAEIDAIADACRNHGDWRLGGCTLYVTLEPCPMCAGAILTSRVSALVYGAREPISGACGSVLNLFMEYENNIAVTGGVLQDDCATVLETFFRKVRGKE